MGLVTFPWAMLAYKIWHGNKPIDEEIGEQLLWRSWRCGWALAGVAAIFVALDFVLADDDWFRMPAGPVHVVFLIGFLGVAAWRMMYFFSLEDFFQGLSLSVIYLYVPTALFVLTWGYPWNLLFTYLLTWLKDPKVT